MSTAMLLVYICVALAGFVVLVFSWIFGGDHDHDVDHDGDANAGDDQYHWFSIKVLTAFMVAFGAGGVMAFALGFPNLKSLVISLPMGLVIALLASLLVNFFYRQQCNSVVETRNIKGKVGTVVQAILPGQTGEIRVMFGNYSEYRSARSNNGQGIEQGIAVEVVSDDISPLVVCVATS